MSVTIKEIAEYAKISRGTVDRVLNKRGKVSPEVEQRVRMIAEALGYKPNSAAKAFSVLKKKMLFGVLLPSVKNPFFDDVIKGIEFAKRELEDYGIEIALDEIQGFDVECLLTHMDDLLKRGITALALVPFDDSRVVEKINAIVESGIPVVTVNSDIQNSMRQCNIGIDFTESGRLAADLMGLINPRAKVLIVTGTSKLLSHNQRIWGFNEVAKSQYAEMNIVKTVECNENEYVAYDLVAEACAADPEINAIFITGQGISGTCEALGKIPDKKFSVICFDDIPSTRELIKQGKISATICQQPFEQGYETIQYLFKRAVGSETDDEKEILMENVIKIRQCIVDGK